MAVELLGEQVVEGDDDGDVDLQFGEDNAVGGGDAFCCANCGCFLYA